jgi:hypothetical protein
LDSGEKIKLFEATDAEKVDSSINVYMMTTWTPEKIASYQIKYAEFYYKYADSQIANSNANQEGTKAQWYNEIKKILYPDSGMVHSDLESLYNWIPLVNDAQDGIGIFGDIIDDKDVGAARYTLFAVGLVPLGGDYAKNVLKKVPLGFSDTKHFLSFGDDVAKGVKSATGATDVQIMMRGSAVTGVSYEKAIPFDVGRVSDWDMSIVSPSLMEKAKELGITTMNNGRRTVVLRAEELSKLGLTDLAAKLSAQEGRPVSFMLYESVEAVAKRGPCVLFKTTP